MLRITSAAMVALLVGCASDRSPATCDVRAGEGAPSEFLDLRVHLMQPALAGSRVRLVTYDANDSERIYVADELRVAADGNLEHVWTDAYRRFEYQPIIFYVDADDDRQCTPDLDLGRRHISSAWNPVGDAMLDVDLGVVTLPMVDRSVCADIERCVP